MNYYILAQSTPVIPAVSETLSQGQTMLHFAVTWVAENGLRLATSALSAIVIYIVGAWLAGVIRSLVLSTLNKRGLDHTFTSYLANILHSLIILLVIITALGQLGIPTAQFAALIAAAGLAIGLALQGNLANFASGFLLVFFRPFKRGDYLTAGGAEGIVEEIGIFTTTLVSLDNKKIVVPNSAITGGNITNFSANPDRLVIVPCTVAGSNPAEKVRASLLRAAAGNPHVASQPAPVAVLTHLGENKFTMELRVWCAASKYWDTQFSLNEAVKAALELDGVSGTLPAMRIVQG